MQAAYYLVHALESDDFVQRDADAARAFSAAAAEAGLERIIYLGGLGSEDDELSDHLRSRREVESLLGADGVPVTVLRAAIVIGDGGISWEMTRQLVKHLPAMVGPRWVMTKTQPIALDDMVRYLVGVLEPAEARGRVFEVGGPDVLTYAEMMQLVARNHFGRPLPILIVPLLTPRLSSHWLSFVTDVDTATARNLVDSMSNEVVVKDHSIRQVVPGEPDQLRRGGGPSPGRPQGPAGSGGAGGTGGPGGSYVTESQPPAEPRQPTRPRWTSHAAKVVRPVLVDRVQRDHRQSDAEFRRRRIVVAATLVVGATLLGLSFSTAPGEPAFYPLTIGLAATWMLGSLISGPLHLGHIEFRGMLRRPILEPIAVGLLLAGVFVLGALVFREVPFLTGLTEDVIGYARYGILPVVVIITIMNGIAEELFFRGALFAGIGVRHPVTISTILYTLATVGSGNLVLVFAAALIGTVVGLERRASGGVLGPILTHITWSTAMLFLLPLIFPG